MRSALVGTVILLVTAFVTGVTVAVGQSPDAGKPSVASGIAKRVPPGFTVPTITLSPNGRYGVLVPDIDREREDVSQNAIIDLKTGAIVGTIRERIGNSSGGCGGANPSRWSSDNSLLLWEVEGKWSDQSLVLIRIRNGKIVSQLDIKRIGDRALIARTKRALRNKQKARADYGVVDVRAEESLGTHISLPLKIDATFTSDPKGMHPDTDVGSELKGVVTASGKLIVTSFKMD